LVGREVSIHALSDGTHSALFPTAQDHKAALDGDKGPNTGGMGTITPLPWVTAEMMTQVQKQVVDPILAGLAAENSTFAGLLYPGLMITAEGPKVLEFNARFGDPETQSYMRLLDSDLVEVIEACIDGRLDEVELKWKPGFAATIVAASGGYPGDYKKGIPINGIEQAEALDDIVVFHAGTKLDGGQLMTSGGRVLGVTATGTSLQEALDKAYNAIKLIKFDGIYYRRDIGLKSLSES
jgi:phosphoribosylamine--glycine ligase